MEWKVSDGTDATDLSQITDETDLQSLRCNVHVQSIT